MKKVSVIVPVYNAQDYLHKCIESLVNQTLDDIELIFIDDGSQDDSLSILNEYKDKYPDKISVYTKENGGQASARNLGIRMSQADYIGFVDADDYVDTTMYQRMYDVAVKEGCDYVECKFWYLEVAENETKQLNPYVNVVACETVQDMFIDPLVSPWNKLFKASLLKDNDITFTEGVIYEDTAFYLKAVPYTTKRGFVDEKFVYHFLWPGSTMNANRAIRVGNIFAVIQDIVEFYQKKGLQQKYFNELEYFCVKILLCSSLNRISLIKDSMLRKDFTRQTIEMVYKYFPGYRKNPYMKSGKKNLYMKCINRFSIYVVTEMLHIKNRMVK